MNILNKLTLKHLKMNKKRTIVTIIGILLSTSLMVGIGLLCSSLREYSLKEAIASKGKYHASINQVDLKNLELIKKNSNIDSYFLEIPVGFIKYNETPLENNPYLLLNEVDKNYLEELTLIEGRMPQNDQEIVIPNHMFNNQKVTKSFEIGNTITLEYGHRTLNNLEIASTEEYNNEETLKIINKKEYKIVGFIERSKYESNLSPSFSLFTKINNLDKDKANVYLVYKNPKDTIKLTENLIKQLEKEENDISYNSALLSLYGTSNYGNLNSFFSIFMIIFLSIISIACVIVIYNSFTISVMERKKHFGLFSSIGATKNQIRKTVLFEASFVGIIGLILGIIASYIGIGLVIIILNKLLVNMFNFNFELVTYPLFIIIPIIFVIITVFISAYLPALKASKISPIEVIRQNDDIKIPKRKFKTFWFINKLFGIEGDIALKNIKRNKKKYRITIISLFISIVCFITFSSYIDYGILTANEYSGSQKFDIVIRNEMHEDNNQKEELNKILNHKDLDNYLKTYNFIIDRESFKKEQFSEKYLKFMEDNNIAYDNFNSLSVIVLENKDFTNYQKELDLKEERPILLNKFNYTSYQNNSRKIYDIEVLKNNQFLNINAYYFGCADETKILCNNTYDQKPDINKSYYQFKNIYITNKPYKFLNDLINNATLIISENEYNKFINNYKSVEQKNPYESTNYYIQAKNYEEIDNLGKKLSNNYYYSNITEDSKMVSNFIIALKILFYGFISLVTLIGITSVFNTIYTSINLRRKEFAILRSIGLTKKGFNKMIILESLFFGFKALLYGLPVGIGLSVLIFLNMNQLVENTYFLPLTSIIISIIGILIIIFLTMIYSISKIKKDNILETIRNENI